MRLNGVDYDLVRVVALAAEDVGVDPALLAGIVTQESGWNPSAAGDLDSAGVLHSFGLGQLHDQGAGAGYTPEQLRDPAINARLSARYLRRCLEAWPNERRAGICAYNAGIGYVLANGWSWNLDRYVIPVLASAAAWEEPMRQARVLMHVDAVWGHLVAIERVSRSPRVRARALFARDELVKVKAAVGLSE